jgi:signal transduction histidine kinase
VDVRIASENGSLSVEIEDTGTGISPEFLPSVFERFRQDVRAETPKSGLGLGLAIVRNLVELHGGTVSAKSEGPNKGSLFKVTLPVAKN